MHSESGFFLMQFLYFVILLSSFIFCFGFIFYASQSKDAFRKTCATKAVDLQKAIVFSEKKLFSLNHLSTSYRLHILKLKVALMTAPPPVKPALKARLELLYLQQNQLDQLQRRLIQKSNLFIRLEYQNFVSETINENKKIRQLWKTFLNIFSQIDSSDPPVLSVRPDSIGGVGPNYEINEPNIDQQSVVLKWQNLFTVNELKQKFFNPLTRQNESLKMNYGLICSVGLERTISKWQLKINLDKY